MFRWMVAFASILLFVGLIGVFAMETPAPGALVLGVAGLSALVIAVRFDALARWIRRVVHRRRGDRR